MPVEPSISLSLVLSFALVLARVSGAIIFVPLPGLNGMPAPARIVLGLSMTLALSASWPTVDPTMPLGRLIGWIFAEATLGIAIGLIVAFVLEAFVLGAQMLSTQAGFSYASTIDPNTQADSTVLQVSAQLAAGLLFFATNLDHYVILAFSNSLRFHPPGSLVFTPQLGQELVKLGAGMFTTGFRLVLPLLALLLMLDLSLGLLGRLNAQLQLVTLAFPVKTLTVLALFAWTVLLFPRASSTFVERAFGVMRDLTGP